MKKHAQLELLCDLTQLLKKHGTEAFCALARDIEDPEKRVAVVKVLREVANSTPQKRRRRKVVAPTKNRDLTKVIEKIKSPDRDVLIEISTKLMDRKRFRRLGDVREFAERVGLSAPTARSWVDVVESVIKQLAQRPTHEVTDVAALLEDRRQGSTLSGWADIILPGQSEDD